MNEKDIHPLLAGGYAPDTEMPPQKGLISPGVIDKAIREIIELHNGRITLSINKDGRIVSGDGYEGGGIAFIGDSFVSEVLNIVQRIQKEK